ncbi:hypothetical protein J1614_000548 [Plenodomus biglobosus]|nr:hypothetical protein J1614_000548 [Plenodomus biglobosus]
MRYDTRNTIPITTATSSQSRRRAAANGWSDDEGRLLLHASYDTTPGVTRGCPPHCSSSMAHATCSGNLSQFAPTLLPKHHELLGSMVHMLPDAIVYGQSSCDIQCVHGFSNSLGSSYADVCMWSRAMDDMTVAGQGNYTNILSPAFMQLQLKQAFHTHHCHTGAQPAYQRLASCATPHPNILPAQSADDQSDVPYSEASDWTAEPHQGTR